jgi:hypothetical protein
MTQLHTLPPRKGNANTSRSKAMVGVAKYRIGVPRAKHEELSA